MSIIHEALRKAQESRLNAAQTTPVQEPAANPAPEVSAHVPKTPAPQAAPIKERAPEPKISLELVDRSPVFWRALGVTSLLGLLLVGIVGVSTGFHLKKISFFGPRAHVVKPTFVSAPVNLVLNGIMLDGNHRVAVINDQTYQVGDVIEGKKITSISIDHVTMQNGQSIFELRTRV